MTLASVRIDDGFWESADPVRRAEWRAVMLEIAAEGRFLEGAAVLRVTPTEQGTAFALTSATGEPLAAVSLSRDALSRHVTEYVDICRQLASDDAGYGSPRFEVLDMAKRVAHDDAGRAILRACGSLGVDHATSRRLFTLLFALRVDTTKLVGVFTHRPIR